MINFDKILKLSRRIAAALLNEEKPEDLEDFDLFSEEDKKVILNRLTRDEEIEKRLQLKHSIETEAKWQLIKSRIQIPVKHLYWPYAAAAAIVVLLGLTVFFKSNQPEQINVNNSVVNTIPAGTDKATLTLENGDQIVLQNAEAFNYNHVHTQGNQVYYDTISKEETKTLVYNYLTIPRGGQFSVFLADGTQVWLNSESQLKYPVQFIKDMPREVELVYGEAYFDVSPSTAHNGATFRVKTGNQDIEVLGTEFNVKAYSNETLIKTTLVEGKVNIKYLGENYLLLPDNQSVLNKGTQDISFKKVNVLHEISWKDGLFSFDNTSLKDIMVVLSRWYNFEVEFKSDKVASETFVGTLGKHEKIEDILENLKELGIIKNYKFDEKKIIIE